MSLFLYRWPGCMSLAWHRVACTALCHWPDIASPAWHYVCGTALCHWHGIAASRCGII